MEIFIRFEARSGEFAWEEDREAREAAAAALEEEKERLEVTA